MEVPERGKPETTVMKEVRPNSRFVNARMEVINPEF
jgi:hypothetical protein